MLNVLLPPTERVLANFDYWQKRLQLQNSVIMVGPPDFRPKLQSGMQSVPYKPCSEGLRYGAVGGREERGELEGPNPVPYITCKNHYVYTGRIQMGYPS